MSDTLQARPDDAARPVEYLSVVYSSIASVPFDEVELAILLATSRMNNEAQDVTGVLLHRDGHFMQALEGPVGAVRAVLRRIAADERHHDVWTLDEEYLTARRFGSWSMGYRPLSETDLAEAPAWFGSPEALQGRDGFRAAELLAWFRSR